MADVSSESGFGSKGESSSDEDNTEVRSVIVPIVKKRITKKKKSRRSKIRKILQQVSRDLALDSVSDMHLCYGNDEPRCFTRQERLLAFLPEDRREALQQARNAVRLGLQAIQVSPDMPGVQVREIKF